MGCTSSKRHQDDLIEDISDIQQNIYLDDATIAKLIGVGGDHVQIQDADPRAFDTSIVQRRQQAIDNRAYRTTIDSWQSMSLEQLVENIKSYSKGKSLIDRHWMIFYWITRNIQYDTQAYFSNSCTDQSVETVFRTRKGVCSGYANLYKYLCDQMQMPCEIVFGYCKGYRFDNQQVPSHPNHAWNAVEIDRHWYLIESTWGAGHLNTQHNYVRKLNAFYFLPHPSQTIYQHLPENENWQLLRTPINMIQFMEMPRVYTAYFELDLELVSPRNRAHVDFLPGKPYAIVLIRAPRDVHLMADLKLNDQKIVGGHRVIFNDRKRLYCCYFAPATIGEHKITIYGKQRGEIYDGVLDLTFDVKKLPPNRMSFPEIWESFSTLGLEVISPSNTYLIRLDNGVNHTEIQIRAPKHVELVGRLTNEQNEEVIGADHIYYDQRNDIWRCQFALNQAGHFNALILAKNRSSLAKYTSAVSFAIEAKKVPSSSVSYPHIWQLFHDLGLQIEAPKNRANAVWPRNASYAEVLIRAPDDVILSCDIEYDHVRIENGSLAQFDHGKNLWQLLFAPERTGQHELIVFARRKDDTKSTSGAVVRFNLDVTKLRRPMKFPVIYTEFQTKKCRIYTPLNGILKKNSAVSIRCFVPGARDVNITVDSKWLKSQGYSNSTLRRKIRAGSREVMIYAKYEENSERYIGLVKYSIQ